MAVWVLLVSFLAQKLISKLRFVSKLSGTAKALRPREPWQPLSARHSRKTVSSRKTLLRVAFIPWCLLSKRRP